MTSAHEYDRTTKTYPQHTSTVEETVEVHGVQVDILRHVDVRQADVDAPIEVSPGSFEAVRAGTHTLVPAEATFYLNDGQHHRAGTWAGGRGSGVNRDADSLGRSDKSAAAVIAAARRNLANATAVDQYGDAARRAVRPLTDFEFGDLPTDATIEPGDLVAVWGHGSYRRGVAVKVTKTKVHALFSTPSGNGHLTSAQGKTGAEVRLVRKARAIPTQPQVSADDQIDAGIRAADVNRQLDDVEAKVLATLTPAQPAAAELGDTAEALAAVAAAGVIAPPQFERSTGTCREPEKFATWSPHIIAAVLALPRPAAGPVVLITVRGSAAVIGPFDSPQDALRWWNVEYNRTAGASRVTIQPAPGAPAETEVAPGNRGRTVHLVEPATPGKTAMGGFSMQAVCGVAVVNRRDPRRRKIGPAWVAGAVDCPTCLRPAHEPKAPDTETAGVEVPDLTVRLWADGRVPVDNPADALVAEPIVDDNPLVWVFVWRRGAEYHDIADGADHVGCGRSTTIGTRVRLSEAVDQLGSKRCPRCPTVTDAKTVGAERDQPAEPAPAVGQPDLFDADQDDSGVNELVDEHLADVGELVWIASNGIEYHGLTEARSATRCQRSTGTGEIRLRVDVVERYDAQPQPCRRCFPEAAAVPEPAPSATRRAVDAAGPVICGLCNREYPTRRALAEHQETEADRDAAPVRLGGADVERVVCVNDGLPIERTDRGPRAKWRHVDGPIGCGGGRGNLVATPAGVEVEVEVEVVDEPAPIGPAQLATLFAVAGADPNVWISTTRRGVEYHRPEPNDVTGCKRTTRYGEILPRSEVIDRFGSKPCRRCYPDGDDTIPLVDGRYPIVLVGQDYGQPKLAEVRKAHPDGRIVQVVYLQSRTGAWIKADRIIEPASVAAVVTSTGRHASPAGDAQC